MTSARFERSLLITLEHEVGSLRDGGFVNHPKDPGGATKYGVSLRLLRKLGYDIDRDGDVDIDDVRALTKDGAAHVYWNVFWRSYYDPPMPNKPGLIDVQVATKVFDTAVNMGHPRAHRILQRSANACGYSLDVDGDLGKLTLAAVNDCAPRELLLEMCFQQINEYATIIKSNNDLEEFRRGWYNRARWPFRQDAYVA